MMSWIMNSPFHVSGLWVYFEYSSVNCPPIYWRCAKPIPD
jgi:hypothetical protein